MCDSEEKKKRCYRLEEEFGNKTLLSFIVECTEPNIELARVKIGGYVLNRWRFEIVEAWYFLRGIGNGGTLNSGS